MVLTFDWFQSDVRDTVAVVTQSLSLGKYHYSKRTFAKNFTKL